MSQRIRFLTSMLSVTLGAAALTPAFAQTASPDQGAPAPTADAVESTEVVVTARRRAESLQSVPVAVTALTAEDIANRGIVSVADYANVTPNVNFTDSLQLSGSQLSIRGQTQERYGPPPGAVVVDGVLQITPAQFNANELDLTQIEVLRGPQGAVYGKNAIAGAINITTLRPSDLLEGHLQAGYASGNDFSARGSVSGPLIPGRVYALGAISYRDRRGQLENDTTGNYQDVFDDLSGRLRIVAELTDNIELDVKYTRSETTGFRPEYVSPPPGANPNDNDFPITSNVDGYDERSLEDLAAVLTWDLGFATLTANASYVTLTENVLLDGDSTVFDFLQGVQGQDFEGQSEELRLTSSSAGPLQWMVGVYHVDYSEQRDSAFFVDPFLLDPITFPVPTSAFFLLSENRDHYQHEDWAGFAQVSYDISPSITVDVQIRHDREVATIESASGNQDRAVFSRWQPKGTITFTPSTELTLYASVGEGFRVGDFNPTARAFGDDVLQAESARTYEIGSKWRLWDRRMILNAAAFWTDLEDGQFKLFDFTSVTNVGVNLDETRIRGFEVEAEANLTEEFQLNAAVGYTDAEIRGFTPPAGYAGSADIIGNRPTRVPEWTANLGFEFEIPVSEQMNFFVRPDLRYTGEYFWDVQNAYQRDSDTTLNIRTGLNDPDGSWMLTAYARAALNDDRTQDYQIDPGGLGFDLYYPPVGSTYGIQLDYRF